MRDPCNRRWHVIQPFYKETVMRNRQDIPTDPHLGPTLDVVAALRREAGAAGDLELAAACRMAIEDDDAEAWEAVMAALDYAANADAE